MFTRVVTDIGVAAEWAAAILTIAFLIQYTIYAKWWKNLIGRSIVLLDICLLGLLVPADILNADPHLQPAFEGHWYLLTVTLDVWLIVWVAASRIWAWHKLHRAGQEAGRHR